ncbi:hypothetical protein AB4028_12720, partial [Janibacter sp. RAF20_2_2]
MAAALAAPRGAGRLPPHIGAPPALSSAARRGAVGESSASSCEGSESPSESASESPSESESAEGESGG